MTRSIHYQDAWRTPDEVAAMKAVEPPHPARADFNFPAVMSDIGEYQSQIDGSMISSRSTHREHLARNNCVEVGSDAPTFRPRPSSISKGDIAKEVKETIEQLKSGSYVPPEDPRVDGEGVIIEEPDVEPIDLSEVKNGDYIRSNAEGGPKIIIP